MTLRGSAALATVTSASTPTPVLSSGMMMLPSVASRVRPATSSICSRACCTPIVTSRQGGSDVVGACPRATKR